VPKVAVVFTGGTIAMRADPAAGGNVPVVGSAELLRMAPRLDEIADVEPIDWGLVPASHLTFEQVLEIGGVLRAALDREDITGAVVVQGTDVMEETAFAWDLLPLPAKPVIVVGAMRSASDPDPDGPENLRNAIGAAADPDIGDQGVLVAMAGELHAAAGVRKTHTHALATFQSPNDGPLGHLADGRVTELRRRADRVRLPGWPDRVAAPVPLVAVALDDKGAIEAAAQRSPAGLVVAATGGGNTPPGVLAVARRLMDDGIPVALTTRCPSGRARPGYAFPGGSTEWWNAGAIFAGTLDGLKARVLLSFGIGAGLSVAELGALCEPFGGGVASGHETQRTPS
jgi:L-asparaginase